MNEFESVAKTYVKSKNSVKGIYLNYTYSLLIFIILTIISYIFTNNVSSIIPLVKSLIISLLFSYLFEFILNINNYKSNIKKLIFDSNIHLIGLIIGLFASNINILVLITAILLSVIVKKIYKNINIACSLFGILVIILYKYYIDDINIINLSFSNKKEIINYLFNQNYINNIFSIIAFIFLFHKKSIKYNLFIAYLLSFILISGSYSLLHAGNLLYLLKVLALSNIVFLSVYNLTDYGISPTISEGQIIYGIILGIISAILSIYIPELASVISLLLGPIILTNYIDKISYKFKYNPKLYNMVIIILIFIMVIVSTLLILFS